MTRIIDLPRQQSVNGLGAILVFGSTTNQLTYGITFADFLDDISGSFPSVGNDREVIFNQNGVYGGDPNFQWDYNAQAMTIVGTIAATSFNGVAISSIGAGNLYLSDDGTYKTVVPSPAGADTQVQFNDAGVLNGDAGLTFNKVSGILTNAGAINANNFNGVSLTNGGLATNFLNEAGNYVALPTQVAGADTQIQFNSAGAFAASANLTWNGTTLGIIGAVTATTFNGVALTTGGAPTQYLDGTGAYSTPPDTVVTPGGANTEIQFNNGGAFAGSNLLTWNGTTVNAPQFNGVGLTTGGSATLLLNQQGNYVQVPAAGAATQIQLNTGGVLSASAALTFDGAILAITGGAVTANTFNGVALSNVAGASNLLDGSGSYRALTFSDIPEVSGEYRLDTLNGTVTPLSLNTPAKALTGGNDVAIALNGVTKPVDNRLQITLTETSTIEVGASCSWDKSGGGTNQYRMHIYQDDNPMTVDLFQDFELSGVDTTVMLQGSAEDLPPGTYYFEVWIEGLTDGDDIIMETGQMWLRRKY